MKKLLLSIIFVLIFLPSRSLSQALDNLKFSTDCMDEDKQNIRYKGIKSMDISSYINEALKPGQQIGFKILGLKIINTHIQLIKCNASELLFIKNENNRSFTVNKGFIIKHDGVLLYISFNEVEPTEDADSEFLKMNLKLLFEGNTNNIHSIMILDEALRSMYSVRYKNSKPLYIIKSVYSEKKEPVRLVAFSTEKLNLFTIDPSLKVFDEFVKWNDKNLDLIPISPIEPHINRDYIDYLWLFENNYPNTLFYPSED